ncbi:MAG: IS66 family transposase [Myxococcaceae bacterium]|nr:IS66 family transposase [Myxococcaceae bacterium]MCI0673920.1 IS66 family transposase [Myxococcaceae bacterium]
MAALEARLRQNSQNSSRPPSSDPPDVARIPKKPPSERRPGGQPGHEGHERELLSEEEVNRVVAVKPCRCRRCGRALSGKDPAPRRHQVWELVLVRPWVIEYQLHTLSCSCGEQTSAELPEGVPKSAFGPRLQATVASCTGLYHLSKRITQGLMRDLFGVELSTGSVSACERAASAALAVPVERARVHVQRARVANADETGWREARRKAWLWTAVAKGASVFLIHPSRGAEAARTLLGKFAGHLGTDRWVAYNGWKRRQLCWAHLLRHFEAFYEDRGETARIGTELLVQAGAMFAWWEQVKEGSLSRRAFRRRMAPVRERVEVLLREGAACERKATAGRCREILKLASSLWTFVNVEGVEPTNNAAERALRSAVLWRKGSFGTHSSKGSRFVERMLTVAATLRQKGRNAVEFVTRACEAASQGQPAPSLLRAGHFVAAKPELARSP